MNSQNQVESTLKEILEVVKPLHEDWVTRFKSSDWKWKYSCLGEKLPIVILRAELDHLASPAVLKQFDDILSARFKALSLLSITYQLLDHHVCQSVLDSLAVELKVSKDFSKLYAGIAILWLHLSLNQPSVVYCFFFFSDLFPLINER
ncbi:hypothetical protein CXB51_002167 [Gossypium anomalum]|uniref:Uncharacterized protein n=1 Tax=Gossypium anomalum TaxID=47600 RepID=A0A8J5ZHE5_9ROSI|nr:hypothetical protein CXB51_002167 [Gossypium anomalum]